MARRIIATVPDFDMEYLVPNYTWMEELEQAGQGSHQVLPEKTLRGRQYGQIPLVIKPKYKGDFLEKLKEKTKEGADPSNMYDVLMPADLLKHQEHHPVHDLTPEVLEYNKVDDWVGMKTLRDWYDRGWDPTDAPEMSEDKYLRFNPGGRPFPQNVSKIPYEFKTARNVVRKFLGMEEEECGCESSSVVANFLLNNFPIEGYIDYGSIKVSKTLDDFEKSLIYTKEKGWRNPDAKGVSVRLSRADPKTGRWIFRTSSGGPSYTTVFQFIPKGNLRETSKLHVRVSCSCPSWLFWGAQYNAFMGDYLYGKIRPKLTPPKKRDPYGRFLVCKHVLACIPVVSRYRLMKVPKKVRERIRKAPKVEVEKKVPKEKIRIPSELKNFGRRPDIKEIIKEWDDMTPMERRKFIMELESPGAVAFMGHRFPETATAYVAEKLKDMSKTEKLSSMRNWARRLLRFFI